MSKIITPPDIINEDIVYLLVNSTITDLEMVTKFLQISNKEFTIHLYHDGMLDTNWANSVANVSNAVLINRADTSSDTVTTLLDHVSKIVWIGKNQKYDTAMDYLYKNA